MSNSPTTQRAWVYRATGQPAEVLKLEESHPLPVPKKDELLIKVKATDLNRSYSLPLSSQPSVANLPSCGIAIS